MAYQQNKLTALQQRLPFGKKLAGGVPGRVAMTLQDGASTIDILTGILQVQQIIWCERQVTDYNGTDCMIMQNRANTIGIIDINSQTTAHLCQAVYQGIT